MFLSLHFGVLQYLCLSLSFTPFSIYPCLAVTLILFKHSLNPTNLQACFTSSLCCTSISVPLFLPRLLLSMFIFHIIPLYFNIQSPSKTLITILFLCTTPFVKFGLSFPFTPFSVHPSHKPGISFHHSTLKIKSFFSLHVFLCTFVPQAKHSSSFTSSPASFSHPRLSSRLFTLLILSFHQTVP